MKCEQFEEQLSAYLDGELTSELLAQLEAHLAACTICGEALARMRHTVALVQNVQEVEVPAELRAKVFARIASATPVSALACAEVADQLHYYLDGELDAVQAQALEAHLEQCVTCDRELKLVRQTMHAISSLPKVAPPQRIWQQVAHHTTHKRPWFLWRPAWGLAAAAAVTFAVVIGIFHTGQVPVNKPLKPTTVARVIPSQSPPTHAIIPLPAIVEQLKPVINHPAPVSSSVVATPRHQRITTSVASTTPRKVAVAPAVTARPSQPKPATSTAVSVERIPVVTHLATTPATAEEPKPIATRPIIPDDADLSGGSLIEPITVAQPPKVASPAAEKKPRSLRIAIEPHVPLDVVRLPDRSWRAKERKVLRPNRPGEPSGAAVAVWESKKH